MTKSVELKAIVEAEVKFVMDNREKFAKAFIAETGLHPTECVMIERKSDNGLTTSISFQENTFRSTPPQSAEAITDINQLYDKVEEIIGDCNFDVGLSKRGVEIILAVCETDKEEDKNG